MARGDIKWFAQALHDLGNKIHDMDGDDFRLGIVTNATAPTVNTAAPHWGGTGTVNFSANQVSTAGSTYTGPIALATEQWILTATGPEFRITGDVTIAQDASTGFMDGYWAIIYNNSDANKRCICYIDLGGPAGNKYGPLEIKWNGGDNVALSITQS